MRKIVDWIGLGITYVERKLQECVNRNRNEGRKMVAVSIVFAMVCSMVGIVPVVKAAEPPSELTINVSGTLSSEYEEYWSYSSNCITIKESGPSYIITGSNANAYINVTASGTVNITLNNASLSYPYNNIININPGKTVNLNLLGAANTLTCTGGGNFAAIGVPDSASLIVDGTGALVATGYGKGAGIGSNGTGANCGTIRINGGKITATGGYLGAGIGGAGGGAEVSGGNGGNITITGGEVTATGGALGGSGIGGGAGGNPDSGYFTRRTAGGAGGNIIITGGTVKAYGGSGGVASYDTGKNSVGAGIGGGFGSTGGSIGTVTISGGDVTAKGGSFAGDTENGLAASAGSDIGSGGTIESDNTPASGSLSIIGGSVTFGANGTDVSSENLTTENCTIDGSGATGNVSSGSYNDSGVRFNEITGYTALSDITLSIDEHLVDLSALKTSNKLPTTVTVSDGNASAYATITDWSSSVTAYDGTTAGTYTLTATWTMPSGYVDAVSPITVTQSIVVSTVQTARTYTATIDSTSHTFTAAAANYSDQTAKEFTISNSGNSAITGLTASLGTDNFAISTALSASELSSSSSSATLSVRPVNGLAVGTYTDTLTITGNNSVSVSASLSFTVNKADQTSFAITDPGTKTYGDASFTLATTGGDGDGAVSYALTASPTSCGSVTSAGVVTITGAGTIYITATKAASTNYNVATDTIEITVAKANQTSFSITNPGSKTFGDTAFQLATTGGNGNGAVTYALTDGETSCGSVTSAGIVTITGTGTIYITATKATSNDYNVATANLTITVTKADPQLTLTVSPTDNVGKYGDPVTLTAGVTTAGSGSAPTGNIVFKKGTETIATVALSSNQASTEINDLVVGDVDFTAEYSGDSYYSSDSATITDYNLNKANQAAVTISAPATLVYGDTGKSLTATGGSGNGAYVFSASANNYVDIASDGSITVKAATNGNTVTVSAYRVGNTDYNQSSTATIELSVSRQAIAQPSAIPSLTYNSSLQTGVASGTGYTISNNTATNADDYTATVTPDANHQWNTGENVTQTRTVAWSISRLGISVPTANTPLTYDGSLQTGVASGTGYTVSDNTATNAGTYTATITPDANHQWNTGENVTQARTVSWSIGRLGISVPTANVSLTYSGNVLTGVNSGTGYTITGNQATNAGSYTATATPDTNHQWNSGENVTSSRNISWSIGTQGIAKPTLSTNALTYNGGTQTILTVGIGYTVTGNTGKDVASYHAIVSLDDNHHWSDNTTGNLDLAWSITPFAITVTANNQSKYVGKADPTLTYTVSPALFLGDSLTGSLRYNGSAVGTYTINENTPFANANYAVTFVSGTMTILETPNFQQVEELVDDLPSNGTTRAFADQVVAATIAYEALSQAEKDQVSPAAKRLLAEAQAQAAQINRTDTEGYVSGDLPWNVRLVIDTIPVNTAQEEAFANTIPQNKELIKLFEIKLEDTINRSNYNIPAGQKVMITLNLQIDDQTGVVIFHQKSDGTIETIPVTIVGDTIVFDATSFSLYGVAMDAPRQQSDTDDSELPSKQEETTPSSTPSTSPRTTAYINPLLWYGCFAIIALGIIMIIVALWIRRRDR